MPARLPVDYVGLLPSVNIGGRRMAMTALRDAVTSTGATGVKTYVQSGNVVFRSAHAPASLRPALEQAIEDETGLAVSVLLRTRDEMAAVVDANPYRHEDDPTKVHVFFVDGPAESVVREVDLTAFAPETFELADREIYMHLPQGIGRAKLPSKLFKPKVRVPVTARNWRSVSTLLDLVNELSEQSG